MKIRENRDAREIRRHSSQLCNLDKRVTLLIRLIYTTDNKMTNSECVKNLMRVS